MTLRGAPVQLFGSGIGGRAALGDAAAAYNDLLRIDPEPLAKVEQVWPQAGSDQGWPATAPSNCWPPPRRTAARGCPTVTCNTAAPARQPWWRPPNCQSWISTLAYSPPCT
jgi:hypothetical protein